MMTCDNELPEVAFTGCSDVKYRQPKPVHPIISAMLNEKQGPPIDVKRFIRALSSLPAAERVMVSIFTKRRS